MQASSAPSHTQTTQLPVATPVRLVLSLNGTAAAAATAGVSTLGNIPRMASDLVRRITGNDLFTIDQKTFASNWEGHFIQLLNHSNQLLPAKAICFLGMKVITPALVNYADNRLASEQLIPFVQAQRELLALLLPENSDVEGFIIQCEEVYNIMLETTAKLNDIIAMNQETERLLLQAATGTRERILSNANQSREMLRELAQQWRQKIHIINAKLSHLNEKADELNQKFQKHSHELEATGTQLAAEQQVFQGMVEELKNLLNKV